MLSMMEVNKENEVSHYDSDYEPYEMRDNKRNSEDELSLSEYCHSDFGRSESETDTQTKIFTCDTCEKSFTTKGTLKRHKEIHLEGSKNRFPCNICYKKFSSKGNLNKHKMRHTGENLLNDQQIYHCEFCEYTTSRTDNLKRHSKRHTGEPMLQKQDTNNGEFSCNICDKSFARRENLRRHEQIHSGIRPFSCHVCEKSFRQRNELVYHQSSFHNIGDLETFSCDICNKEFRARNKLNEHMKFHEGETTCDVCSRVLCNVGALRKHKNRGACHKWNNKLLNDSNNVLSQTNNHQNEETVNDKATIIETPEHNANEPETENQYSCDVCKKSFTDQEKLTNHMRIHKKGGKNHACDLCPMKFYYPNELMGHKSRTHKIEGLLPTFPCDLCGRDFIGRNKLNEHMKTHTGEATCDLCNKVFYSVSSMKKHRERLSCQRFDGDERKIVKTKTPVSIEPNETFSCDICTRVFKQRENFSRHMKRHTNERSYPCDMCPMAFFQRYELISHKTRRHNYDGLPTLYCEICNKKFLGRNHLNAHMKMHNGETTCQICGHIAYKMEGLKRHLLTHRFSTQSCKECDRDFKSDKDLKRHITLSHTCKMCKTIFTETKDLETHRETSISCIFKPKTTISCDQCLNEYENKKLYKEHLKSSKTCSAPKIVKLYSCDACNKVFTSKPKYTKHVKTHSMSITLVQPNNDGLIPGNIIKFEQVENDCDSNMVEEFKMADTNSSSSDSENSNMARNYDTVTTDFCLEGSVKLEPIIEESADLNLAGNFMKTADLAGVSESNKADQCASFSCTICKIDYHTSELLQTHLKTKYHAKRAANNVISNGHADENPDLTINGETADNNGKFSVFVNCSEEVKGGAN